MSSSDMRIIKDAKISCYPVLIAMHEFEKLNVSELFPEDTGDESYGSSGSQMNPAETSVEKALQEGKAQSEMLLAAAVKEITRMKSQSTDEVAGLKSQATEEGKHQGLEEARQQMAEQLQQTTERCNAMLAAAVQESRQIVLGAESQIIELVLAISRKIICDEMEERPEVILGIVRTALQRVRDQSQINIRVCLDDYERILQARRELQGIVGADQVLKVTADAMMDQGDCLIETSFGTVEAGVDTQLESIRRALQEILP